MNLARLPAKANALQTAPDLELSDQDFQQIARMVHTDFGLHLQESKKALVFSRLARRVRDLGLPGFAEYVAHVGSKQGEAEKNNMLSALTTNVTQFFREAHHFDQLRNEVLPPLIKQARGGARIRLWSAACSAGQEPYSMAATLLGLCPDAARLDIKILATDIDPVILEKARAGRYPKEELMAIPAPLRDRSTRKIADSDQEFEIAPELRELITFNIVNLVADWPMKGAFDVILCRNVAIYFDKETQARLWRRFTTQLKPGGYLMIGHSERLGDTEVKAYRSAGITAYQKHADTPAASPDRHSKENRK